MTSRFNRQEEAKDDFDNVSNVSYSSNNDDETILTATITFDVTVDQTGQVISTSEGQVISEVIQDTFDGGSLSNHYFGQNQLGQFHQYHQTNNPVPLFSQTQNAHDAIQADSLTSMNSQSQQKDMPVLHDSLDELDAVNDSDEEESTTTESLIERSKKYMDKEAGIIILRRDEQEPQNFNINLDFELKSNANSRVNKSEQKYEEDFNCGDEDENSFNINLDFDLHCSDENINMDSSDRLQAKQQQQQQQQLKNSGGVGIDLMIKRTLIQEDIKIVEEVEDEEIKQIYTDSKTIESFIDVDKDDKEVDEENLEDYLRREILTDSRKHSKIISDENLQEGDWIHKIDLFKSVLFFNTRLFC